MSVTEWRYIEKQIRERYESKMEISHTEFALPARTVGDKLKFAFYY